MSEILTAFNSYHPKIQFTYEEERDGRLPYLDMTLVRQTDNTIRTEWYKKEIASGRLLNFRSVHPLRQKINIATNFIDRVNKLSTNLTVTEKKRVIIDALTLNDYPRSLIHRYLNRTDWNIHSNPQTDTPNPSPSIPNIDRTYRSLPYIPKLTPRIIQLLKPHYPTVAIATRSTNTVNRLYTAVKDATPVLNHHNVIYRIQCENCECCYVGLTTNLLKTRLAGHRSNVHKLDQLLQSGLAKTDEKIVELREKTALIAHCVDHDHRFDLTHPQILDQTFKPSSLPFLEMVWIHNTRNTVNKRTDTDGLNSTYTGILNATQKHKPTARDRPPPHAPVAVSPQ